MPRTLAQNAQYIAETIKPAIKSAIEAQGVTVPSTDSFLDYADRIREIEGGGSGYQLKDLPTGAISTVNDAAELPLNALKVSVEAVQDLHGYDHPWAAGGGKNKLPLVLADIKSANTNGTWSGDTYTIKNVSILIDTDNGGNVTRINIKSNGASANVLNFLLSQYTVGNAVILNGYAGTWNTNNAILRAYIGSTIEYATGATGSVTIDVADTYNIGISIKSGFSGEINMYPMIRLASVADATFAPYSNICPISGWDSGEIGVVGKNWTSLPTLQGLWILENGAFSSRSTWCCTEKFSVKPNETYTFSATRETRNAGVVFYEEDGTTYIGYANNTNYGTASLTFTTPSNCKIIAICIADKVNGQGITPSDVTDLQLELGTTATTYEPYQGNQYTQQFPTTIYGAEWDVVNGVLSQTDGYIASYNGESLPSTWISDRDVYDGTNTPTIGAEVVYKLATPTTIDLSPLSIRLLEGTNNVYADCGEVIEGEYFVDEGAIDIRKVDYQIGSSGSIKTTDGRVLSGFASMNGYHARPLDASGNWLDVDWSKSFEIGVAFKMTEYPSSNASQYIFGNGTNDLGYRFRTPRVYFSDYWQSLLLDMSLDGSSWYMDASVNFKPVLNTWYFIRLKFDLSTLRITLDITTDFETYTTLHTEVLSSGLYHNGSALGIGGDQPTASDSTTDSFMVDTFNTYVKGDGVSWGASTGAFPS